MSNSSDEFRLNLSNHTLRVVAEYPGFIEFRLGLPNESWMESTRILITRHPLPEQIILTGDLCHGANGILSDTGYGLGWFARPQGESYLCEKFLRREWVPQKALDALRYRLDEADEYELTEKQCTGLALAIECSEDALTDECSDVRNSEAFYSTWVDIFGEPPEDEGYGYNPRDASWLCAIQ